MARKKKEGYVYYWEQDKPARNTENVVLEKDAGEVTIEASFGSMGKSIPVNIGETADEVVVKAKVPGVARDEIELNVTEDSMDISVEKYGESVEEDDYGYKEEVSTNSVRRFFTFPAKVDRNSANAKLKNGVLTVRIKKLHSGKR